MPEFNDRRPTTPAENRVTKGFAALWHGGSAYGSPYHEDHLEHFPTIGAARDALRSRRDTGHNWKQRFQGLTTDHTGAVGLGEERHDLTPAVDENSYMDLHPIKSDGTYDRDVFQRMEFGKRGGIKRSWS